MHIGIIFSHDFPPRNLRDDMYSIAYFPIDCKGKEKNLQAVPKIGILHANAVSFKESLRKGLYTGKQEDASHFEGQRCTDTDARCRDTVPRERLVLQCSGRTASFRHGCCNFGCGAGQKSANVCACFPRTGEHAAHKKEK